VVEQADTCAQQERHQVDMDFVEQSGLEALLHDRGGGNDDTLLSGDRPGLRDGAFHSVADEGERPFLLDPFWRGSMGHHNDWDVQGMSAPHPLVRSNNLRPATSAPICL
jgi:hypothetical protein